MNILHLFTIPVLFVFALFVSERISKADIVLNVSGMSTVGELGDARNSVRTFNVSPNAFISDISWTSVSFRAFDPSWLSEVSFALSNSDESQSWTFRMTDLQESGTYTGSGTQLDLVDSTGGPFTLLSDGILRLETYETFADAGLTPNAVISAGSLTITAVPEPSSMLLFLPAAAWVATRMRHGRSRTLVAD
jgi:hypothetical protein